MDAWWRETFSFQNNNSDKKKNNYWSWQLVYYSNKTPKNKEEKPSQAKLNEKDLEKSRELRRGLQKELKEWQQMSIDSFTQMLENPKLIEKNKIILDKDIVIAYNKEWNNIVFMWRRFKANKDLSNYLKRYFPWWFSFNTIYGNLSWKLIFTKLITDLYQNWKARFMWIKFQEK